MQRNNLGDEAKSSGSNLSPVVIPQLLRRMEMLSQIQGSHIDDLLKLAQDLKSKTQSMKSALRKRDAAKYDTTNVLEFSAVVAKDADSRAPSCARGTSPHSQVITTFGLEESDGILSNVADSAHRETNVRRDDLLRPSVSLKHFVGRRAKTELLRQLSHGHKLFNRAPGKGYQVFRAQWVFTVVHRCQRSDLATSNWSLS